MSMSAPGLALPLRQTIDVPWVLLGVLLVAGSALTFAVLGSGGGSGARVVALSADVAAREVVRAGDLRVVEADVADDAGLVAAARLDELVGRRALVDLRAGTLVTASLLTRSPVLGAGEALVGVRLDPSAVPGPGLAAGDAVMVVRTPGDAEPEPPVVWTGLVHAVTPVNGPGGETTLVALRVDPLDAPAVAAAAATDRLRLVLVRSLDDVPPELLFTEEIAP